MGIDIALFKGIFFTVSAISAWAAWYVVKKTKDPDSGIVPASLALVLLAIGYFGV